MSLTVALNSARSSLMAAGIAGVRHIAQYRRRQRRTAIRARIAVLVTTLPGNGVYVAGIQRATSAGLFYNVLKAASASAKQDTIYNGLQKIAAVTVDDPELDQSPAAQLAKLKSALQQYATAPDNATLAQAAVYAAKDVATSLNDATKTVQSVRADADADMATSVADDQSAAGAVRDGQYRDRQGDDHRRRHHRLSRSARQHPVEALAGGRHHRRHARQQRHGRSTPTRGVTLFETSARSVTLRPDQCLYGRHHRQCRLYRWRAGHRRELP